MISVKKVSRCFNNIRILFSLFIFLFSFSYSFGQDDEEISKIDPLVNINFFKLNDSNIFVRLNVKYKEKKNFYPITNQKIRLYLNEADSANLIGDMLTNLKGEARIVFSEKLKRIIESESSFDLIAEMDSSSRYNSVSELISIVNVHVEFETEEVDSVKYLRAYIYNKKGEDKTPLPEIELNFFVARSFGLVPLSTENLVTDESGMAEMELTDILPGDEAGDLMLTVKLSDKDTYGEVANFDKKSWGKKVVFNKDDAVKKALWASRANVPLWLLVISNSIIIAVWGTIFYLLFQIYNIKKAGNIKNL